ncbi:uncharacterized protein LOC125309956 [Alosa alosa]|uniref:uncharacterized protein LOC125309956 n=1 Tax=Alosa alosa TaxID=278164 RepID=UPI002015497D|nr:uncharacterized protein LOC125309956 [Alosa alosa]
MNGMGNNGKSSADSKPAPQEKEVPEKKSSQKTVTKATNRISYSPITKSATESLTRTRLPNAETSANSQVHVSKLASNRVLACEFEKADKRQASTVKITFSRPLVKESSLQALRGPLKTLQSVNLSHRPLRMCSDASASSTTIGPFGTKGQQVKAAVMTQPKAGRRDLLLESIRMRRPPWRMGTVVRDVLLPRLKPCSFEGYQQQPASPCMCRLRGDRGQRAGLTAPLEENPKSFKHHNWLMPISFEPTSANPSRWEESARPSTPTLNLLNRALSRKGVRQRHSSFTLQGRTQVPRRPDPNGLDLSQISVPLHLPNYPYAKIHLTLPTVCCPTSLCRRDHSIRQASPSESDPEYSSDYEDESAYESDSDTS